MSWEDNVRKVVPYTPGEQPKIKNIIKLNTNENPYPPSPLVYKAYEETELADLRKYPDPVCSVLVDSIASFYDVKKENVFVGVGSDDVISMAFLTFFNSDKHILFPDITYSFYDVWADLYRIPYKQMPLKDDFSIDPRDYYGENGGVVIANPNAPTGVRLPLEAVEDIILHNKDVVVIVDEAYVDFGGESALPLINKYDNLLVVRTFSKSRSLAGLRIGYAFGCEKIIKYLLDAKFSFNSYTMNMPSLILGAAAMNDRAYFEETTDKVINTRERVKKQLRDLGFVFEDSKTNFIFARHPDRHGREIFDYLRAHDIIIRRFDKPRIDEYLRISIGTDEEMDRLIEVLKEYLGK